MAEFKKNPNAGEVPGPFDAFPAEALGQFAMDYWPVVLGGLTLFILILGGKEKVAIPVGIIAALLQAWLLLG